MAILAGDHERRKARSLATGIRVGVRCQQERDFFRIAPGGCMCHMRRRMHVSYEEEDACVICVIRVGVRCQQERDFFRIAPDTSFWV